MSGADRTHIRARFWTKGNARLVLRDCKEKRRREKNGLLSTVHFRLESIPRLVRANTTAASLTRHAKRHLDVLAEVGRVVGGKAKGLLQLCKGGPPL